MATRNSSYEKKVFGFKKQSEFPSTTDSQFMKNLSLYLRAQKMKEDAEKLMSRLHAPIMDHVAAKGERIKENRNSFCLVAPSFRLKVKRVQSARTTFNEKPAIRWAKRNGHKDIVKTVEALNWTKFKELESNGDVPAEVSRSTTKPEPFCSLIIDTSDCIICPRCGDMVHPISRKCVSCSYSHESTIS